MVWYSLDLYHSHPTIIMMPSLGGRSSPQTVAWLQAIDRATDCLRRGGDGGNERAGREGGGGEAKWG